MSATSFYRCRMKKIKFSDDRKYVVFRGAATPLVSIYEDCKAEKGHNVRVISAFADPPIGDAVKNMKQATSDGSLLIRQYQALAILHDLYGPEAAASHRDFVAERIPLGDWKLPVSEIFAWLLEWREKNPAKTFDPFS